MQFETNPIIDAAATTDLLAIAAPFVYLPIALFCVYLIAKSVQRTANVASNRARRNNIARNPYHASHGNRARSIRG